MWPWEPTRWFRNALSRRLLGREGLRRSLVSAPLPCLRQTTDVSSGDGRLGIFVAKQKPNVRCYGSAAVRAIVNSCQSIMDRMDVSNEVRTFGTGGIGVDVELPFTWHSGQQAAPKVRHYYIANVRPAVDNKCIMTLRTSGPSDSESWHRVWETATFVTSMCTRQGKKGLFSQIGELQI